MKRVEIALSLLLLVAGCVPDSEPASLAGPGLRKTGSKGAIWKNGQEVELTGTIWPSKGGTTYYIDADEGGAHLKSEAIAKLKRGTTVWVKGVVEYVHFPRPKDYYNDQGGTNYAMVFPQTLCCVNVAEFKVIGKTP